MSISRGVDKQTVVDAYSRIHPSTKRSEELTQVTTWMDLKNITLSRKSQSRSHILYGSNYMKYPEAVKPWRENTDGWLLRAGKRGEWNKTKSTQKIDIKLSNQWAQKRTADRVSGILLKKWCFQSPGEFLVEWGFGWLRAARGLRRPRGSGDQRRGRPHHRRGSGCTD